MKIKLRWFVAVLLLLFSGFVQAGSRQQAKIIIPKSEQGLYDQWHFAPAIVVGDMIYLSGVIGDKFEGDVAEEKQIKSAFDKIDMVLKNAGSSLDDVIEMTSYHVDIDKHLSLFGKIKDQYIKPPYPAWSAIGISALAVPWAIVEVKVIAKRSK